MRHAAEKAAGAGELEVAVASKFKTFQQRVRDAPLPREDADLTLYARWHFAPLACDVLGALSARCRRILISAPIQFRFALPVDTHLSRPNCRNGEVPLYGAASPLRSKCVCLFTTTVFFEHEQTVTHRATL